MTWALIGRWIVARFPQIVMAIGAAALLWAAEGWWFGFRSAPLAAQIATLKADLSIEEQRTATANESARLRAMAAQKEIDAKHAEDKYAIETALGKVADLTTDLEHERATLAKRLRDQWQAGRASGRADRAGLPETGGSGNQSTATTVPAGVVSQGGPAPDRFDREAAVTLTGERDAAIANILWQAAKEGRCVVLKETK